MNIQEMLQSRGETVQKMRAMLDEAEKNGVDLDADQAAVYDKMDKAQMDLMARVNRAQKQADLENSLDELVGQKPCGLTPAAGEQKSVLATGTPEYMSAFRGYATTGPSALTSKTMAALQVGTDAEGGYLVPEEWNASIVEQMQNFNDMRTYCTQFESSSDRNIPIEDTLGTATWTAEEAAYTESDPVFGNVVLGAYKLGTIVKVSEELLRDNAFDLPGYLARNFGSRFGIAEESAMINGDGSEKPTGIVQGSSLGTTAAATTAITGDELIDLFYSVKAPYRRRGTFILNDTTTAAVRKLKDSDGQYIWQPGLQLDEPERLLNRPLISSDAMPEMTTGLKSVIFGDLSYYMIGDRSGTYVQRLMELFALNGQIGFRAYRRTDGKTTLPEAIKHLIQA